MKVVDAAAVRSRYARIADRFKATWTAHQMAAAAFAEFLSQPLPYQIDLALLYEETRTAGRALRTGHAAMAVEALDRLEAALDAASADILAADAAVSASLLRRFLERLKHPDDAVVEALIRFYLYADSVEGDRRDKLDLLFTRLGSELDRTRGEFVVREGLALRQQILELVSLLRVGAAPHEEAVQVIRAVRSLRDEILCATRFDDLTERNLLKDARTFKHRVGDLYFHPDVLLSIVELNVAARNRFMRLYGGEEQQLVEDADKLMEHGSAIARNFGDASPGLAEEIARFRALWEKFGSLRAQSNVKHEVVTRLKASMNNILVQLDRGLDPEIETAELPPSFFDETRQLARVTSRFGNNEPLVEYLLRIDAAVERADASATAQELADLPLARPLRLEPWEAAAYQKLFERQPAESGDETEELWRLFVRGAALRIRIDEEATILATAREAGVRADSHLLARAKQSLDLAKELDAQFGELVAEASANPERRVLHQLYRSRFRLVRGFSGLWLIYDKQA
jgi:hypothetical protein